MLNGKGPFHFAFDTGGVNVIDPAVAKELGVTSSGLAEVTGSGSATVTSSFAVIKRLQVGDALVTNQVLSCFRSPRASACPPECRWMG